MNAPANFTNRALNQDQRHVAWLQRIETPSGRGAAIGVADKVGQHVRAAVANADAALSRLPDKIVAIVADKTRESAALKHDAVRTVGLQTIATLQRSQKAIREGAADALARSDVAINDAFVPDPVCGGIESEIRGHIRTLAAKPDGLAEIRKLVASDREAAGVFSYSPPYLLNVAPEVKHRSIRISSGNTFPKHTNSPKKASHWPNSPIAMTRRSATSVNHGSTAWRTARTLASASMTDDRSPAKRSLSLTSRWSMLSSSPQTMPNGKPLSRGAYLSIVGQRMDQPLAGTWNEECFVVAVDRDIADGVHLAPPQMAPPVGQDPLWRRMEHVAFLAGQGRELGPAVWLALPSPEMTLCDALAASGVGTGLADRLPYLFVRTWSLPPKKQREMTAFFPYVSSHVMPDECEIAAARRQPAERMPPMIRFRWG